jgi:integral membrane sensor domain MASE1
LTATKDGATASGCRSCCLSSATLAEPVIGAARVEKVVEAVDRLETLKDVKALTQLLTTIR